MDIRDDCWEYFGMSYEDFLDRYTYMPKSQDPLIKDFEAGEVRQFNNTPYHYLIVECNSMPGIKLKSIWNSEREDPLGLGY